MPTPLDNALYNFLPKLNRTLEVVCEIRTNFILQETNGVEAWQQSFWSISSLHSSSPTVAG